MPLGKDDLKACKALAAYFQSVERVHDSLNDLKPHVEKLDKLFGRREISVLRMAAVGALNHMLGESEDSRDIKKVLSTFQRLTADLETRRRADV